MSYRNRYNVLLNGKIIHDFPTVVPLSKEQLDLFKIHIKPIAEVYLNNSAIYRFPLEIKLEQEFLDNFKFEVKPCEYN
jgi:hypothetical protein